MVTMDFYHIYGSLQRTGRQAQTRVESRCINQHIEHILSTFTYELMSDFAMVRHFSPANIAYIAEI